MYGLQDELPACGVIDTCCSFIGFYQQVQNEARPEVFLGGRSDVGQIDIFPKHPN